MTTKRELSIWLYATYQLWLKGEKENLEYVPRSFSEVDDSSYNFTFYDAMFFLQIKDKEELVLQEISFGYSVVACAVIGTSRTFRKGQAVSSKTKVQVIRGLSDIDYLISKFSTELVDSFFSSLKSGLEEFGILTLAEEQVKQLVSK